MNKIFCLNTGDHIIGHVEQQTDLSQIDQEIIVYDPMYIVQTISEYSIIGFKLEDALLFSSGNHITLQHKNVITIMDPSESIDDYYKTMVEYNDLVLKPMMNQQIQESYLLLSESLSKIRDKKTGGRFKNVSVQ